jgi:putative ATP-dependent DNA ligase
VDSTKLRQIIDLGRERKRVCETDLGGRTYLRFIDKFRGVPEGTIVIDGTVVWGYPKIGRILWLETGVPARFQGPFWVEEKIDGYNVRIFRLGDELLAFTRRGYLCPFTTDRLPDLLDVRVFEEHPETVVCGEVAGPENPYNEGAPPFISTDVKLFIFDLMEHERPGFLPHRDKIRLLAAYGLPGVPQLGRHEPSDLERLRELLLRLDEDGHEGIILKEDSPKDRRVKYVTGRINISDIRVSEGSIRQLPAEFFMHRVLRLVLFQEEHGIEPTPEICRDLGESMINGARRAIEQFRNERRVYHRFRCRFRRRRNAELMMQSMTRLLGSAQVRQRRLEKMGDYYVLEFDKMLPKTTGMLEYLLGGGVLFD